jgi:hypothetical protein
VGCVTLRVGAITSALALVAVVAAGCGGGGGASTAAAPVAPATTAAATLRADATCRDLLDAAPAARSAYLADPRFMAPGLDSAELLRRCADAPSLRPDDVIADQMLAVELLMQRVTTGLGAVASRDFLRTAAAAVRASGLSGEHTGPVTPRRLQQVEQDLRRTVGGCRTLKHCASTAGCSQPDSAIGVLECAVTTASSAPPDPGAGGTTTADGSSTDASYGAVVTMVFVRVSIGHDGHVTVRR